STKGDLYQIVTQAKVAYDLVAEIPADRYWITLLSCTKGIENLIVVRAGCQLPHAFDVRLSFLANQSQVAALSPLLSSGAYFSAFLQKKHKPGLNVNEIDQWLGTFSKGQLIDVPELATSCVFLRCKPFQDALDEQPLASDADLLQKLM